MMPLMTLVLRFLPQFLLLLPSPVRINLYGELIVAGKHILHRKALRESTSANKPVLWWVENTHTYTPISNKALPSDRPTYTLVY